jgi:LmbE family N-acetylglucosaminyl deacetylase
VTAGDVLTVLERLPYADVATILGGKRPLILAPHPDDESLGCGGLIAECCERGEQPVVAILTDGAASHVGSKEYPPERLRQIRAEEVREAVARLGLEPDNVVFFGYADSALPKSHAISTQVATLAQDRGCDVIVGPWLHDPHCDHEAAAIIAQKAADAIQARLLSYPIWGWLLPKDQEIPVNEVNGWKLPISTHMKAKQRAIAAHASQYSNLIDDAPNGFRLPRDLLALFERPYEVFIAQ